MSGSHTGAWLLTQGRVCVRAQTHTNTASLRAALASEKAAREAAQAQAEALHQRLVDSEAQLAAALGRGARDDATASGGWQDPSKSANAALAAALDGGAALERDLQEARAQCAALHRQLMDAREAASEADVMAATARNETEQLRARAEAAERQLSSTSQSESLATQLAASRDALAASRAEIAGLNDELHVMRAAASASGRDADLVADAAAAHAKVTLLLVREARLQRALETAAATEQAMRRELRDRAIEGGEHSTSEAAAARARALAYIDEIKRLRLANDEIEARLTRKAEALAEAVAEAAAAVAERDATQQRLDRLMVEIGGGEQRSANGGVADVGASGIGVLRMRTENEEEAIARVAAAAQATITRLQRACNEKDALLARAQAAAAQQRADAAATAASARAEIERLSDALLAANDASIAGFRRALLHDGDIGADGVRPIPVCFPRSGAHGGTNTGDQHSSRSADELRALLAEKDAQIRALKASVSAATNAAASAVRQRSELHASLDEVSAGATARVSQTTASHAAAVRRATLTVEKLKAALADKDVRVANLQADVAALQNQLRDALEEAAAAAAVANHTMVGLEAVAADQGDGGDDEESEQAGRQTESTSRASISRTTSSRHRVSEAMIRAQVLESVHERHEAAIAAERRRADTLLSRISKLQAALSSAQQARADAELALERATQAALKQKGLPPRPPGGAEAAAAAAQKHYEEAVKQRRRADALQVKLSEAEASVAALQTRLSRIRTTTSVNASGGSTVAVGASGGSNATAAVIPMLRALHEECEAAHARASAAEAQLVERQARVSATESATTDGGDAVKTDGELTSLRAALAARDVALAQAQAALDASTSRCARLTARLDALFSAASNGQLKMIASTGRATGRNNAADGGDIPATDTAAEVAAAARRSATLAFAQRTVARLQKENDTLKAQVHALTSKLSDADTKLSDAGAQVSRQDTLLAAAAEATARCEALERQLAAIQQEQQKRASEAPSLHATTEPAAGGDVDERAAEGVVYFPPAAPSDVPQKPGRLTTSSFAAATTASAPASSGAGAAPRQTSHAAEMDLRRRLSALEAALAHARADCARLEDENAELRAELASLDPAFFDFVDQLKGKTQVQEDVLARYESLLRQYADALGLPFTREHVPDAILHI